MLLLDTPPQKGRKNNFRKERHISQNNLFKTANQIFTKANNDYFKPAMMIILNLKKYLNFGRKGQKIPRMPSACYYHFFSYCNLIPRGEELPMKKLINFIAF